VVESERISHNSTNQHGWFMLKLMANRGQFFIVGHILLDVGLLGFISNNNYLAYIGLICALPFFIRELIDTHLAKRKKSEDTTITI
jgi:hypothetical protein